MVILAWLAILLAITSVLGAPFCIGMAQKPYGARNALCATLVAGILGALAGRVLGWW